MGGWRVRCREFSGKFPKIWEKFPRNFRKTDRINWNLLKLLKFWNHWKFSTTEIYWNYWNFQILTEIISDHWNYWNWNYQPSTQYKNTPIHIINVCFLLPRSHYKILQSRLLLAYVYMTFNFFDPFESFLTASHRPSLPRWYAYFPFSWKRNEHGKSSLCVEFSWFQMTVTYYSSTLFYSGCQPH